ncbi:snRNA-activating protein complex subunit 4 [Nymphon striatum]|nr:snRNA-activating protein complex subunit 4 [Nymphon striatum]
MNALESPDNFADLFKFTKKSLDNDDMSIPDSISIHNEDGDPTVHEIEMLLEDSQRHEQPYNIDITALNGEKNNFVNAEDIALPVNINSCLALNMTYQDLINEEIDNIEQMLHENTERQKALSKEIEQQTSLFNKKNSANNRLTLRVFTVPYFKDSNGISAPLNRDALRIKNLFHLDPNLSQPRYWCYEDIQKLIHAVKESIFSQFRDWIQNRKTDLLERLKDADNNTEERSQYFKQELIKVEDRLKNAHSYEALTEEEIKKINIDWLKISISEFKSVRDSEDCRLMWKNILRPGINKSKWKNEEDMNLLNIVNTNPGITWEEVSEKLNTQRTAHQCLERHGSKLVPAYRTGIGSKDKFEDVALHLSSVVQGMFNESTSLPWPPTADELDARASEEYLPTDLVKFLSTLILGEAEVEKSEKSQRLFPEEYKKHVITPGPFHTVMNYIGMLTGHKCMSSGYSEILLEAGLVTSGCLKSVLKRKAHAKDLFSLKTVSEAMERLLIECFSEEEDINVTNPVALLNAAQTCGRESLDHALHDPSTAHISRVNHRLAIYKRADIPIFWSPKPYDPEQGWERNDEGVLEPVCNWTKAEDECLKQVLEKCKIGEFIPWSQVHYYVETRTRNRLYIRWDRTLNPNRTHGRWAQCDDLTLAAAVKMYGKKWKSISKFLKTRSSQQCRDRYVRSVDPDLKFESWTVDEDDRLIRVVQTNGEKSWKMMCKYFPGRKPHQLRQRYFQIKAHKNRQDMDVSYCFSR